MPRGILRLSAIALAACLAAPAALAQDGHGAHSHGGGASQATVDVMAAMIAALGSEHVRAARALGSDQGIGPV